MGDWGHGCEILGLAVKYFLGSFGGDLKLSEIAKVLKAIGQSYYFYRLCLQLLPVSLPLSILYLHLFLFIYVLPYLMGT